MKIIITLLFILLPISSIVLADIFGGSMLGGIVIGIVLDVLLFLLGVRIVNQNTVKVVELLGKYNRILRPGMNVILPLLEWTKPQDLFKKNVQIAVDGLTMDNVSARIGLNVVYYVKDNDTAIFQSVYEIDNPTMLIKASIDEQLRSMMSTFTHKDIYMKRQEMGNTIESSLRVKLEQFGYSLDSIQVQDIQLDARVMSALNKIVETEKLKEAAFNEAEAKRISLVKEAEADKEAKKLLGEGMAEQRMAISEGFKESIEAIKACDQSLTGEMILQFLLDSSRIETLEKVGRENAKIIYINENLEASGSGKRIEKILANV